MNVTPSPNGINSNAHPNIYSSITTEKNATLIFEINIKEFKNLEIISRAKYLILRSIPKNWLYRSLIKIEFPFILISLNHKKNLRI